MAWCGSESESEEACWVGGGPASPDGMHSVWQHSVTALGGCSENAQEAMCAVHAGSSAEGRVPSYKHELRGARRGLPCRQAAGLHEVVEL